MDMEFDEIHWKGLELIKNGESLFVTGKAGTGKSTYLNKMYEMLNKTKSVVKLSPTGIAANNVHGYTIHSFLRLPLGIFIPGHKKDGLYNLDENGRNLVRRLDIGIFYKLSL